MKKEEAIEILQSMKSDFPLPKAAQTRRAQNDALDAAIEALKAEPRENAMLKEIATKLAEEIKSDLIKSARSGERDASQVLTGGALWQRGEPMSDLISRQDAIDALHDEIVRRRISEDANDDGALDEFDAEAILRRLPSAQPEQRWIPVAERLPEKGQKCLVSDKGHITIDVFWGRGGAYNWQFYTRDYEAWMPLVKPYSAEGRTDSDGRD